MALQLSLLQDQVPRSYGYEKQMMALIDAVGDGVFRSLAEIESALGYRYSQTGISARLRDLRKNIPGFERWRMEHRREGRLNWYRVWLGP
jgi:hypothetical protein